MASEHISTVAPGAAIASAPEVVRPDPAIATEDGAVQYHFLGQTSEDQPYSGVMRQNAEILMGMGGLVHGYMKRFHPTVDRRVMDIDTWKSALQQIPDLAIGQPVRKSHVDRIAGDQVAHTLLGLIANAVITDDGSVVSDFSAYLNAISDATFAASNGRRAYRIMTCTFLNYLVDNGLGGYYDHAAIVLREVDFPDGFQNLKSSCGSTAPITIELRYTEITAIVQTGRLREGRPDHGHFQSMINPEATARFANAGNFFNAGATPQSQIRPTGRY